MILLKLLNDTSVYVLIFALNIQLAYISRFVYIALSFVFVIKSKFFLWTVAYLTSELERVFHRYLI